MILQVSLWAGIVMLYIGIAGAVGLFSRQAIASGPDRRVRILAAFYSIALFLPATAIILALVDQPFRSIILLLALAVILAALARPQWIPDFLWRRTFTYHYMASVMAFAALWGIMQAQDGSSLAPLLVTVSAVAAAAASSGATLRLPRTDMR